LLAAIAITTAINALAVAIKWESQKRDAQKLGLLP
jgi:hypothetical protein